MFYDALKNDHGLPHDPFKALVVPRPIGWISSLAPDGTVNLAPYSFFNAMATDPHYVLFGSGGRKDSQRNIEETGEFVCNLATWDLREEMNRSSAAVRPDVDEIALAGLTPAPCARVRPPRVKEAPAALECVYDRTITLEGAEGPDGHHPYAIVLGKVVGIHIDDSYIRNGLVDTAAMKPIARCGYMDYAVVTELFQMRRPDVDGERGAIVERETT
ncbi:flavin reductase family protein [Kaustia mangrovi]|uniref:Flavin reductase family protein n=1 Tax=Kaustia mangrovi TaxID=2593653 RepID=A0A7S8HA84_9HYPH|nr:flavin reductase family protein [Kaustia mangrovi]QPC41292.1 flavin reductase family protein [Kaustia mangrovi]